MLLELFFNSQMNGLFQYNFCKCLSKEARLEMGDVKCRCAGLDSVRVAGKGKKTPIAWCGGCRRSRKARMKNGRRPGESRMKIVIRDSQRFSNSKPFETNKIYFPFRSSKSALRYFGCQHTSKECQTLDIPMILV